MSSNFPCESRSAGSTMMAPALFISSVRSFISESTASLKPKYLRATPMRAPFRPLGSRKRV